MSFFHSSTFKYIKNLIIGVGASVVMIGALFKITSHPLGDTFITVGLVTEAILFAMLGILPPEKDYYWEKLYPGLEKYDGPVAGGGSVNHLTSTSVSPTKALDGDKVTKQLGGMLEELQIMSKSLSSLKALQEVDFTDTASQLKQSADFYKRINEAMNNLASTTEDAKLYKEQMIALNKNLKSLNTVYGNVLGAFQINQTGGRN